MQKKEFALILPLILLAAFVGHGVGRVCDHGRTWRWRRCDHLSDHSSKPAERERPGLDPEADGSFRLLPYTPPFYPLALSGVGLLVKDMVAGARWLNILLFGATIVLIGWFFYRATARPWLAAILSGVLATSPVILGVQVWAMSESIFLFLGFAGLFALLGYFDRPRKRILVASAVLCGLAFLTRYIGVAFVGTGVLALLLLTRAADGQVQVGLTVKGLRGKFQAAFWFGLIAVLPTLIWLVIDYVADRHHWLAQRSAGGGLLAAFSGDRSRRCRRFIFSGSCQTA